jgi:hypothetical protein
MFNFSFESQYTKGIPVIVFMHKKFTVAAALDRSDLLNHGVHNSNRLVFFITVYLEVKHSYIRGKFFCRTNLSRKPELFNKG